MGKSNQILRQERGQPDKSAALQKEFDQAEKSWKKWQAQIRQELKKKQSQVKQQPEAKRTIGEVVFYHNEKRFGFVMFKNQKVFIHIKEFKNNAEPINRGDSIEYEIKTGKEGRLKAINITKVNRASGQGIG